MLAQDLIRAATTAVKTGFAVPAAPIPAPDAAPEFEAERADAGPSAPASGTADSHGNLTADAESENDNAINSSADKENSGRVNSAFSPAESAGTAIAAESQPGQDFPLNENELAAPIEPDVPVTPELQPETLVSGAVSDSDASIENFGSDENLSLVFEEAELRLDELLADMQIHASASPKSDESKEEGPNRDQSGVTTNESQPMAEIPELAKTAFADAEEVPLFHEVRSAGHTRKYIINAASALGLLFTFVAAGFGIWFLSGSTPVEPVANTSPKETGPPVAPQGMAYVPGGEFMIGSDTGDEYSRPAHNVSVKPFFIDLNEVTNEEYKKFVDASGRKPPPDWRNGAFPDGKAKFPVTGVTWDDANAFAAWADKRLPTEQEWEFAARGTDGRIYPWGPEWKPENANADKQTKGMREVGLGGKSPFGLFDMSGNAWEWTASHSTGYTGGKDFPHKMDGAKIIRGGSWTNSRNTATSTTRAAYGPDGEPEGYSNTGFRCAKEIPGD